MLYKITWEIKSPIETQLQSDTIFGHLCWALSYTKGEDSLKSFLAALRQPIFSLSSAFPQGSLPAPKLKGSPPKLEDNLKREREKRENEKKAKKRQFVPMEIWQQNCQALDIDVIHSKATVIEKFFTNMQNPNRGNAESMDKVLTSVLQTHNTIDRNSGTTKKGAASLYSEEVQFYDVEKVAFESYIQTDYFSLAELDALFGFISESGFGRNKHTGRGKFQISICEHSFPLVENPNAWLLLSNAVPAPNDPPPLGYEGFVKHGKLGGGYATGGKSPFKKPLFMLKPGAVFIGPTPPVGTLVCNIHPNDPDICQNAYALCLGFKLLGVQDAE